MTDMNTDIGTHRRPSAGGGANRNPGSNDARASTRVTAGVKFKGEITGRAEIVVDGEVEGRLEVQAPVVIGASGLVRGDIVAQSVRVGGKVVGNVKAGERFELEPTGRIEGDVTAPRIVIAEGAFFKGDVEMTGGRVGSSSD